MYYTGSYITASGVTLSRKLYGENTYYSTLFLKHYGLINATARATMYPGEREPLIWAVFKLRKKSRSRNYFIEDTDIKDDMLALRKSKEQIITALNWCGLIIKHLEPFTADNELLANLYWNMKIMCERSANPESLNWRFIWRWLCIWGLAPDIYSFFGQSFTQDEIDMLNFTAQADLNTLIEFFRKYRTLPVKIFSQAFDLSLRLLLQK